MNYLDRWLVGKSENMKLDVNDIRRYFCDINEDIIHDMIKFKFSEKIIGCVIINHEYINVYYCRLSLSPFSLLNEGGGTICCKNITYKEYKKRLRKYNLDSLLK